MVVVFSFKLIDLQVVRANELVYDAQQKTTGYSKIFAHRGSIVDTNGDVLAESVTQFTLTTSPKDVSDIEVKNSDGTKTVVTIDQLLDKVAAVTGPSATEMRKTIDDAKKKDTKANYAVLATGLNSEQRLDLPKIGIP